MSTFGKTTIGAKTANVEGPFKRVNAYNAPDCGVTKLSIYFAPAGGAGTVKIKPVIYADANGKPGAKIAVGAEHTFTSGGFSAGWVDFTFSSLTIGKQRVYIGFISNGGEGVAAVAFDETAPRWRSGDTTEETTGGSDPFGEAAIDTKQNSCYATITALGPPTLTKPANQTAEQGIYVKPAVAVASTNCIAVTAENLPAGISIDPTTGRFSGRTSVAVGDFTVTVHAEGVNGTTLTETFVWHVIAAAARWRGFSPSNPMPGAQRYGSADSPFNLPIGSNPQVLPNSSAIVAQFLEHNTGHFGEPQGFEGVPVTVACANDPVVELIAETPEYKHVAISGRRIHLPDGTRPQQPANTDPANKNTGGNGVDAHLSVILAPEDALVDGEAVDLWQVRVGPDGFVNQGGKLYFTNGGATAMSQKMIAMPGSALAAGWALEAGLVRPQELQAAAINHALFLVASFVKPGHVYPANHDDGGSPESLYQEGMRFQLNYTDAEIAALAALHSWEPWKVAFITALAHYGAYLGDAGEGFIFKAENPIVYYDAGAPDPYNTLADEQGVERDNAGNVELHYAREVDWTRLRVVGPPEGAPPPEEETGSRRTFDVCDVFPPGTLVGVWTLPSRRHLDERPPGLPQQSAVVDSRGLTLALAPAEYLLWAEVAGAGRALVLALEPADGPYVPLAARIAARRVGI